MDSQLFDYKTVSLVASIVMTCVWIVYLHLAFRQYRLAKRPFLIIHHAHDNDPSALCLFVNMSKEPVHLQCVIAFIHGSRGTVGCFVTDYDRVTPEDRNVLSRLRQGPIQPGGYLVLGSFVDILADHQDDDIDSLEICVAVIHGPSKQNIGARRRFFVEHRQGRLSIRPYSIHTEQLVSRLKRKTVRHWVESHLDPKFPGMSESKNTSQAGSSGGEAAEEEDR